MDSIQPSTKIKCVCVCDNLCSQEFIHVLKRTVIGHVSHAASSFLAAWHTNILCIVYTKEEAKKNYRKTKQKSRRHMRACGTRVRVHVGRVGHGHEGVGSCVFVSVCMWDEIGHEGQVDVGGRA